ncbi:MAG TPA: DUF2007 domain-containing protein [Candidatus Cloacimonadota bacterium]|jgi:hypothetical protein|nr:DUF2007 domain-containing protein [Candidatus Cloacimonadales bacterium]HOQ80028.1 DUF2007 domain-containing protein [Candidatus Cloacimonadota bacterium]HPK40698.1 DUF2007 domain-containing protein [Candidatus Cloacimonadota bacterium]HQB41746.1 DUF2007 domain-containing protein [Candidatus Cloacimonadota bacterium]
MFCPKCKSEYKEGIKVCKKCQIKLVDSLDAQTETVYEYQDLVSVYRPDDAGTMAIAKSLLENEGIKYFVKNERLQELFGVGRFGSGYNAIFGPEIIQVAPEDAEQAKEILQDLIQESDSKEIPQE